LSPDPVHPARASRSRQLPGGAGGERQGVGGKEDRGRAHQHQGRQTRTSHSHVDGRRAVIVGLGIDIAEVDRIREAIERHGQRFTERIYTATEIAYVERKANRYERYAARFAAKEAAMKAIGTGWKRGVRWQDF